MSIRAPSSAKAWMCGSSLRRPITSPPGGGTLARPRRASSGPASGNEARMRLASSASSSCVVISAACTRTSFSPVHSTSAPTSASSAIIVSTSRIRGTLCSTTGSLVSRHAARMGSAPFLLPAARTRPLSGRVRAAGNKNGALPILAACLLTSEPVVLHNVPRIRDVETMMALLADVGAEVEWTGENEVRVQVAEITTHELDAELASRIRASFLLAGPLLARLGRASVPPPGGDVIGRRRLDPHIHALERLGTRIEIESRYEMRTEGLRGAGIFLDEASVMATENAIMAAVVAPGETTIGNAACEPHVQDLCRFLVSLGARIDGIESNLLRVHGVDRLAGGEWTIAPEHIEVGSFIGLAAVTNSDLTIDGVVPNDMVSILTAFSRL